MRVSRGASLSGTKIKTLSKLVRDIIPVLKNQGKKIVFTNGCFDLLHYGHIQYLEKAKQAADVLIVAVNSDASVRSLKGKNRPIVNEKDRIRVVAGLESVDYVLLFGDQTPLKVIEAIKPDVLIKGADWDKDKIVGSDFVLSYGGRVQTIRLARGRSTTNLIKKIVEQKCNL